MRYAANITSAKLVNQDTGEEIKLNVSKVDIEVTQCPRAFTLKLKAGTNPKFSKREVSAALGRYTRANR